MKNMFSGHCWYSNTMLCPHLGRNYPRGNKYKGKFISQEHAASLDKFPRNQVPSLLYDQSDKGFDPTKWRFHINTTQDARLFLQPLHGDGDAYSNLVHVHRSKNEDDNNFLHHTTSKLIEERNPVRTTNGWNGVGIMVGIGEHLNRNGQHTDFVLKPKYRTMWSNEEEKMMMSKCGRIFEAQFNNKSVGYKEMIEHQKHLWPNNCPNMVTDVPRCWNASRNLGKELSIEICHGTWISWNGRSCGHCSTVPNVVEGDQFLSLFCSIPQSLCNHLMARQRLVCIIFIDNYFNHCSFSSFFIVS